MPPRLSAPRSHVPGVGCARALVEHALDSVKGADPVAGSPVLSGFMGFGDLRPLRVQRLIAPGVLVHQRLNRIQLRRCTGIEDVVNHSAIR
jgi:hypothetical protein